MNYLAKCATLLILTAISPLSGCDASSSSGTGGTSPSCTCDSVFPHAVGTCGLTNKCEFVICYPGYADCNNDTADGCEARLASDPSNCGVCGLECTSSRTCAASSCFQDDIHTTTGIDGSLTAAGVSLAERVVLERVDYPASWDYYASLDSVTVSLDLTSFGSTTPVTLTSFTYSPMTGPLDVGFMALDGALIYFSDPGSGTIYSTDGASIDVVAVDLGSVHHLASDGENLLALRFTPPASSSVPSTLTVVRVPKSGGAPSEIASGFPVADTRRVTILDQNLYFTTGTDLNRVAVGDGAVVTVSGPTYKFLGQDFHYAMLGAVNDGEFVYTIGYDEQDEPRLALFRLRSGDTSFDENWKIDLGLVPTGQFYSRFLDIFVKDGFVYATNGAYGVFRVNTSSGEVRTISLGEKQPTAIFADNTRLYWAGLHSLRSIALTDLD